MSTVGKRSVNVVIGGHRFVLRTDVDERTAQALAHEVDRRIRDIQKRTRGTVDTQQVAVLAALQFAEELYNERQSTLMLKHQIRDRGRALLALLERAAGV